MVKLTRVQMEKLMAIALEVFGENPVFVFNENGLIEIGHSNSPFHAEAHWDAKEDNWELLW